MASCSVVSAPASRSMGNSVAWEASVVGATCGVAEDERGLVPKRVEVPSRVQLQLDAAEFPGRGGCQVKM